MWTFSPVCLHVRFSIKHVLSVLNAFVVLK